MSSRPPSSALMAPGRCVVVLVDYQAKLVPALTGGGQALREAVRLADIAITLGVPVLGTEQNPTRLGPNDLAIRARCDHTLAKGHFDACAAGLGELVATALAPPGAASSEAVGTQGDVVLAGCETHVCLLQTALSLLAQGWRVWVAADACASRQPSNHELGLARLRQAGAVVVSVEMVAYEWLGSCEHDRFKDVLALVK